VIQLHPDDARGATQETEMPQFLYHIQRTRIGPEAFRS